MNHFIKHKKSLASVLVISMALGLGACTKKSETAVASGSSTNDFANLPEVTGPVTSASSGALGLNSALAATTGVPLATVATSTFSSGMSVPMCENVNNVKEILREAASPDKILCYMGKMKSADVIPSTLNVADGLPHYIKLVNLPNEGGGDRNSTPQIKFQIVKSNGTISSFKMWSCFSGTSTVPVQSEYIEQSFTGETATVSSKYLGSESGATFGSSMTATGTFTAGAWSSKNISGYKYYSQSGSSFVNTLNLNQYSNRIDMSIAMKGVYGGNTFENRFFTIAQIINATSLATTAIGDGSSKYSMSYTPSVGSPFTQSGTVSWNGDTKMNLGTASSGDYYTAANAGTVPDAPNTAATVTFTGDQAWDCTAPAGEAFVEANFTLGGTTIQQGMQACDAKYISNNQWVNCPYQ